jgi:predicted Zn finger-like uncharacterized protein
MDSKVSCPSCQSRLRIAEDLIGRTIRCPKCKSAFVVEEDSPFGAVEEDVEVVDDEPPRPSRLRSPLPPPPGWRDDEDDDRLGRRSRYRPPHRGSLILTLGILSLFVCAPLGIAAWLMGNADLEKMRRGEMDRSGEGATNAGRILGIISTCLMLVSCGLGTFGVLLPALTHHR